MSLHFSWWAFLDLHHLITVGCTTLNMSVANVELLSTEAAACSVPWIRWKVNIWQSWGQHLEVFGLSSSPAQPSSSVELLESCYDLWTVCLHPFPQENLLIYLDISTPAGESCPPDVLDLIHSRSWMSAVFGFCWILTLNSFKICNSTKPGIFALVWQADLGGGGHLAQPSEPSEKSLHERLINLHLLINGCFLFSHRICSELLTIVTILPLQE